ncbi:MAG: hypothetical protein JWM95_2807 [Gemmatimonadetes bacterium]|nr:hypothetical protein [Gemmatimonadota bacterium]
METSQSSAARDSADDRPRLPWVVPALTKLAPLTDLTLQTGTSIHASGTPGGGTVF